MAAAQDSACNSPDDLLSFMRVHVPGFVLVDRYYGTRAAAITEILDSLGKPTEMEADEYIVIGHNRSPNKLVAAFKGGCSSWSTQISNEGWRAISSMIGGGA